MKTLNLEKIVFNAIEVFGCVSSKEVILATKLRKRQVHEALRRLLKKGIINKYSVAYAHSRHLGQLKLFGKTLGKRLYYIEREELLKYLAKNLKLENLKKYTPLNVVLKIPYEEALKIKEILGEG